MKKIVSMLVVSLLLVSCSSWTSSEESKKDNNKDSETVEKKTEGRDIKVAKKHGKAIVPEKVEKLDKRGETLWVEEYGDFLILGYEEYNHDTRISAYEVTSYNMKTKEIKEVYRGENEYEKQFSFIRTNDSYLIFETDTYDTPDGGEAIHVLKMDKDGITHEKLFDKQYNNFYLDDDKVYVDAYSEEDEIEEIDLEDSSKSSTIASGDKNYTKLMEEMRNQKDYQYDYNSDQSKVITYNEKEKTLDILDVKTNKVTSYPAPIKGEFRLGATIMGDYATVAVVYEGKKQNDYFILDLDTKHYTAIEWEAIAGDGDLRGLSSAANRGGYALQLIDKGYGSSFGIAKIEDGVLTHYPVTIETDDNDYFNPFATREGTIVFAPPKMESGSSRKMTFYVIQEK